MKVASGEFWIEHAGAAVLLGREQSSQDALLEIPGSAGKRAYELLLAQTEGRVRAADYNCHAVTRHVVFGDALPAYEGKQHWQTPDVTVPLSVQSVRAAVDVLQLPCALQVSCVHTDGIDPSLAILHSAVVLGVTRERVVVLLHKFGASTATLTTLNALASRYKQLPARLRFYGKDRHRSANA